MHQMADLAEYVCRGVMGAQIAYCQSDEISILLHNYKRLDSEAWFANEVQKIASVSAGMASAYLTHASGRLAVFDSRVFVLPEAEVVNYFIFRQQDATRNSLQMLAQSQYSQKQLHGKNTKDLHDLLHEKDMNWNELETLKKRGFCIKRVENGFQQDFEIPIFSHDRDYIHRYLEVEQE
jgi:tRNA(His) 5'-end guanylyltransferase